MFGTNSLPEVALISESEITFRAFYDVPRIFIVQHDDRHYLFDCKFNESIDDYEAVYQVYAFPKLSPVELSGSWESIEHRAIRNLGTVLVEEVVFDETLRNRIDTTVIDRLNERSSSSKTDVVYAPG